METMNESESRTVTNCATVKSGSDIKLTALKEQLQRADQKCHFLKNRLDYMKQLYHMDMDPYASPRMSLASSPRIPPIPAIDEDLYDAENDEKTIRVEPIERSPRSNKVQSEESVDVDADDSEKLVDRWSQKSMPKVYSAHRFFTSSNQEILETLSNKPELVLNLTGRREKPERSRKVVKSRLIYSTRTSKPEVNRRDLSPPRVMKIKRRRTRLKTSNSKSTTASKHVTTPEPKCKKIKRPVNRAKETPIEGNEKKTSNRCNQEVVEIYHNAAIQSVQSFSESSSKPQLKLPAEALDVAKATKNANPKIPEVSHSPSDVKRTLPQTNVLRRREAIGVSNGYECQPIRWCYEPLGLPNYQQPTLASKSKRVNRCYLTARFNLRNIPFVVGTSVTPSHNLGLNIQQALSLMKTKQAALAAEVRPFFIKKLGQGFDPVFCIQQAMDNQLSTNFGGANGISVSPSKLENKQINATEKAPQIGLKRQKEQKRVECRLPTLSVAPNDPPNIKNVFMRLHSKFEEMQLQYDKLQEQAAKSKDEKLQKQISELEDELNAKESEIEAIVGLYTEVMTLKSQIHNTYHQKSSLLCITDCGKFPTRVHPVNHMICQKPRMPSMSMRLTGLLRQIQSFQQQLTAS